MKIRFSAGVVLAVLLFASISTAQTYWKKGYEATDACAITSTVDGGFVAAGFTFDIVTYEYDIYLVKTNSFGDTVWIKTYGGKNRDMPSALAALPDGSVIVAGFTESFGAGGSDVYVLKIKTNGDTLWTRTYGGSFDDAANAIVSTNDGNFLIAGSTSVSPSTIMTRGVYVLKITPNGDTIWSRTYFDGYAMEASSIVPAENGAFIIAGSSQQSSALAYGTMVLLLKIDSKGSIIWKKTYGGIGVERDDYASSIVSTNDGNFIVAARSHSTQFHNGMYDATITDTYLLKINSNGDTLWTKNYGGINTYAPTEIVATSDKNFFLIGEYLRNSYSDSGSSPNGYDAFIIKMNASGDFLWEKHYGTTYQESANAIACNSAGLWVVTGSSTNGTLFLLALIDDRYAWKSVPFTFKIPVDGDSLHFGYKAVQVPPGMTVSAGGTVSWAPTTDSVYLEHAEFYVENEYGFGDALSFNIVLNSKDVKSPVFHPVPRSVASASSSKMAISLISGHLDIYLYVKTTAIGIYDIRGKLLIKIPVVNNGAHWTTSALASGRYIAKALDAKENIALPFVITR
jgi:hypothetical protein